MENKKNIIILLLVIVIAILSGVIGFLLGNKNLNKMDIQKEEQISEEVTPQMLYGTYTWEKTYTTEDGKLLDLKSVLNLMVLLLIMQVMDMKKKLLKGSLHLKIVQ